MRDAVIVEVARTPVGKGKPGGSLHDIHPVDLFATAIAAVVERSGVDPALVDDVIGGCVTQVGDQAANISRWAALAAGLPESVPATTIDRACGSSQQAVHFAAQGVIAGAYDVVVAGGVESMSRVPMGAAVLPGTDPMGPSIDARYPDGLVPQGIGAELIASRWGIGRAEQDEFAARSHALAADATRRGAFTRQLVPVKVTLPDGAVVESTTDQSIRPGTSPEILSGLRPAFWSEAYEQRFPEIGWTVTAGNSSTINDGASAVLITTSEIADRLGLTPRARLHSFAVAGDDPLLMLTAVIPATAKVLRRAGLSIGDIDLFEVNEAFASVVLAWQRDTGAAMDRVNVNGGAISIGHPLGASGTRLLTSLVEGLHERGARWGLQTMCEAGGQANATVVERL